METPLVSIFVQTYQHEAFIGECLASILGQQGGHPLEVIVVDDASRDRTAEVVRAVRDPRVRLIAHERNAGAIATANEGYAAARGKYVARLDGDDRYRPDYLARVIPVFEQHPSVGVVYGDIAMVDPQGRLSATDGCVRSLRQGRPAVGNELIPLLHQNFVPAPGTVGRREVWTELLPIPKSLHYLDYFMTTQAAHRWDFAFVDAVLADYRIHPGNQHSRMVLDGTGERTTLEILDRSMARPEQAKAKLAVRKRVYAANYLTYGDKYFGVNYNADARRCYWEALRRRPQFLLRRGVARHFLGTLMGRRIYDAAKRSMKSAPRRELVRGGEVAN
jgi:glycosyltransferase involved in cell wall biosynthesis